MAACDRDVCVLRLERIAASAKILAQQLKTGKCWYREAQESADQIHDDAQFVNQQISSDSAWEAGDR